MYLQLVRETFTNNSTEGKLFVNGTFCCYTLEDKDRHLENGINKKVYGETCIPRGIYPIKFTYSNRFKKILPQILNVPGFEGIRIHAGNKPENTEGCVLVGDKNNNTHDDWISQSRVALNKLISKLETASVEITIEIV